MKLPRKKGNRYRDNRKYQEPITGAFLAATEYVNEEETAAVETKQKVSEIREKEMYEISLKR